MGLGISGKHQQVGCIIPPANLLLLKKKKKSKREKATLAMSLVDGKHPRTSTLEGLSKSSRTQVPLEHKMELFQFEDFCSLRKGDSAD